MKLIVKIFFVFFVLMTSCTSQSDNTLQGKWVVDELTFDFNERKATPEMIAQYGKEESKKDINYSKYNKSDKVVKVGTKSENPQATALVRNAIATQDAAKIQQAIAEARALKVEE